MNPCPSFSNSAWRCSCPGRKSSIQLTHKSWCSGDLWTLYNAPSKLWKGNFAIKHSVKKTATNHAYQVMVLQRQHGKKLFLLLSGQAWNSWLHATTETEPLCFCSPPLHMQRGRKSREALQRTQRHVWLILVPIKYCFPEETYQIRVWMNALHLEPWLCR